MATKTKTASSPPAGDDKGEPVFGKQETILVTGEGSPRDGDETSKTFRTIAGKAYCLTLTTGGVSVYGRNTPELTPDAVVLLAAKTAGQYIFIAISSYTIVSVDSSTQYVLTPLSFNGAFLGASSGGGGSFDPTSNQTITGMWSFSNIVVPTPDRGDQAANKGYVDSKIAAGTSNLVTLTTEQTISGTKIFTGSIVMNNEAPLVCRGNAEFTAGATRTTKANPVNTDLLNKEMGDAMYAKLSLLTSAEYTALATKDARTVYVTTDTSKVFIGSVAVNP